jgi:hypothetical protein
MRFPKTRDFYIPKGAMKVSDKQTGAAVYVFTSTKGKPAAMAFAPKAIKPAWHFYFPTEARREEKVRGFFASLRAHEERKAEEKAKRKAAGPGVEVGDIMVSMWGYDQTNVDYYEVVKLSGCMATLRPLKSVSVETGRDIGKCRPLPGDYKGTETLRRMVRDGYCSIASYAGARKWNTEKVAGVPVGPTNNWTAYA